MEFVAFESTTKDEFVDEDDAPSSIGDKDDNLFSLPAVAKKKNVSNDVEDDDVYDDENINETASCVGDNADDHQQSNHVKTKKSSTSIRRGGANGAVPRADGDEFGVFGNFLASELRLIEDIEVARRLKMKVLLYFANSMVEIDKEMVYKLFLFYIEKIKYK